MDPRKRTVATNSVYFPVRGGCSPSRVESMIPHAILYSRPGKVACVVAGVKGGPAQHSVRAWSRSAASTSREEGCVCTDVEIIVINRKERHTFLKKETSCCDERCQWYDQ